MTEILKGFAENAAVMTALAFSYLLLSSGLQRLPAIPRQIAHGCAFGAAAYCSMLIPVTLMPGVIFDCRALVLGLAAPFGGPWAAVLAGAVAAAGRYELGGIGAVPGAVGCLISAGVGLAWQRWRGRHGVQPSLVELPLLGFSSALAGLASAFLLPLPIALKVVTAAAPLALTAQPLAALLLGWLLSLDRRLRRAEREARASAERFRDFGESAGDWFWETDPQLRFSNFSSVFGTVSFDLSAVIGKRRDEVGCWTEPPEAMERNLQEMRARQPFVDFRFFAVNGSGETICVSSSGKPVFDEAGSFMGYRGVSRDITRLAKAEARERLANERFRSFSEAAADWYWEMGADLRFTFLSGAAPNGKGRPNSFVGRATAEIVGDGADPAAIRAHLAQLERREAFRDFRYSHPGPDGRVRYYSVSGKPLIGLDGAFLGYRGVGCDITDAVEHKWLAEQARRRLVESIDSVDEGVMIFDPAGELVALNRQVKLMYPDLADILTPGTTYEKIAHASLDRGVIEVAPHEREAWIARRLTAWASDEGEQEHLLGDGHWIRFADRRTPSGGVVSVRVDITDLKRRERQLAERTEQLKEALESIEDGVSVLDADLNLVAWNELFIKLTGTPAEALRIGASCESLMKAQAERGLFGPNPDPEAVAAERLEALQRRESLSQLLQHGGRILEMRRRPMSSGGFITSFRDVTQDKLKEKQLTLLALHDSLTGLANRRHFEDELDRALASPARRRLSLLFLDLDGFKQINDEIGHEAGDRLLEEVASRIGRCVRGDDLAARLGGDEFVVLLKGDDAFEPQRIVDRVREALQKPMLIVGREIRIGASIGVASAAETDDRESLLRAADEAMYRVKNQPRQALAERAGRRRA